MKLIEHTSALEILGSNLKLIRESMVGGWNMWKKMPAEHRMALGANARASVIHDFTIDCASKLLTDAKIFDKSYLKLFVFSNIICLRFKKFDTLLNSSNQPTSQVKAFRSQEQLDGLPTIHNLEAGYTVNEIEQSIIGFHIVCPNGKSNYWEMELLEVGVTTPVVDLFNEEDLANEPDSEPVRYRRKKSGIVISFEKDRRES